MCRASVGSRAPRYVPFAQAKASAASSAASAAADFLGVAHPKCQAKRSSCADFLGAVPAARAVAVTAKGLAALQLCAAERARRCAVEFLMFMPRAEHPWAAWLPWLRAVRAAAALALGPLLAKVLAAMKGSAAMGMVGIDLSQEAERQKKQSKFFRRTMQAVFFLLWAVAIGFMIANEGLSPLKTIWSLENIIFTVGLGDIDPKLDVGKWLASIAVLLTVLCVSDALIAIVEGMTEDRVQLYETNDGPPSRKGPSTSFRMGVGMAFFGVMLIGGSIMNKFLHGLPVADAVLGTVGLLSTLGCGKFDIPDGGAKVVMCIYLPIALSSMGVMIMRYNKYMKEHESELESLDIQPGEFDELDRDMNGQVDRNEFVRYMLLKYDMVSEEDFRMLDEHFRQLDRDGSGSITIDELRAYFDAAAR